MLLVPSHISLIITMFEKANSFLVASTCDFTERALWPWSTPRLHTVLVGNAMELTPQKEPLVNDRKEMVDKYSSFFSPWGDNSQEALCHLLETPGWD